VRWCCRGRWDGSDATTAAAAAAAVAAAAAAAAAATAAATVAAAETVALSCAAAFATGRQRLRSSGWLQRRPSDRGRLRGGGARGRPGLRLGCAGTPTCGGWHGRKRHLERLHRLPKLLRVHGDSCVLDDDRDGRREGQILILEAIRAHPEAVIILHQAAAARTSVGDVTHIRSNAAAAIGVATTLLLIKAVRRFGRGRAGGQVLFHSRQMVSNFFRLSHLRRSLPHALLGHLVEVKLLALGRRAHLPSVRGTLGFHHVPSQGSPKTRTPKRAVQVRLPSYLWNLTQSS